MRQRPPFLLALLILSILYGCGGGILRPSHHETLEYNNAFAAASRGELSKLQAAVSEDPALLKATEWDGMTLLHDAVDKSRVAIVDYLLGRGADVAAITKDGRTPLHIAAQHGNVELMQLLLDHGAPINARDKNGWTPLDRADAWGHADAVAFLNGRGAQK